MGNPLPGDKELQMLAAKMNITKREASEIIDCVKGVVSEDLAEWL